MGVCLIAIGQPFGWLVAGFFALGIPLALFMLLLPNDLKMDRSGVQLVRPLKPWRLAWSDVEEFYVATMYGNKLIAIRYATSYDAPSALQEESLQD